MFFDIFSRIIFFSKAKYLNGYFLIASIDKLFGIAFLIIATLISSILDFRILNYILTSFMTYGVIFLIIIFQPELRRALEQLRN